MGVYTLLELKPDTNGAHLVKFYILLSEYTETAFGSPKPLVRKEVIYHSKLNSLHESVIVNRNTNISNI